MNARVFQSNMRLLFSHYTFITFYLYLYGIAFVCLPVYGPASPPLADLVTWFANFIQLTPSRRALWREEKKTTREKLVFSTFRN